MDRGTALFAAYSRDGIAQGVRVVVAEVASLIAGLLRPRRAIERELRETIEPHLAILIHKRSRYLSADETGAVRADRWAKELEDFIGRTFFWPVPAATETFRLSDRAEIARAVDRLVADAQARAKAERSSLPVTSRFDSSWAG